MFSHLYMGVGMKGITLLNSCLSDKELGLCLEFFESCGKPLNSVGPWPYRLWLTACPRIGVDSV